MIYWWATDFDEEDCAAVAGAVRSRNLSCGPITRQFEEKLAETLGVPYVVCTTSGTTALTMALLAAGVGHGDEVVVPDRTWIGTANAALMTGASVLLEDVDDRGLLPNVSRETLTIPVHLNGCFAGIPWEGGTVIEDACQNFPEPPNPSSLAACYSFSTAKLIPTGQGGCVATRDEGFYRELLALRTHAIEDPHDPKPIAWSRFGYNFRYTDLQASIGLVQLSRLSAKIERLKEIRRLYEGSLPESLSLLPCDGVPLYTEVLYPDPHQLRAKLLEHGIQSRPFHPPLHTAPYIQPPHRTQYHDYQFPNTIRFSIGLTLPSGPAQTNENILRVCQVLQDLT